jgi:hypothetical protein
MTGQIELAGESCMKASSPKPFYEKPVVGRIAFGQIWNIDEKEAEFCGRYMAECECPREGQCVGPC